MSSHFSGVSVGVKTLDSATVSVTDRDYGGRTLLLDRAAGVVVTLPAATGSGVNFDFFIATTVTSNAYTIQVANADDIMAGVAIVANDTDNSASLFETAADTDTVSMNGSTTGGIKGGSIKVTDVAANLWKVEFVGSATGTEATPFSAAVS